MNKKAIFAIVLLAIFGLSYFMSLKPFNIGKSEVSQTAEPPRFRKDKDLRFLKPSDSSFDKPIAIEVADEEWEITQGLMYRPKMDANAGMLFIFEDMRPRSFWMKNTILPLDIIYVSDNKEIVTIQKYTTPFSEESIPSYKPAQYVIEVNAGFCDNNNIVEGDKVAF